MKPGPSLLSRKRLAAALSLASILLAAFVTAQAAPAPTAATAAPLPAQLNRLLHQFARAHPGFPGVALAVETPRLTWVGATGASDRASRRPLTPDATFRIASVTKTFTAAAVLRLVEEGKVALDDAITRHLSTSTLALLRKGGYDVEPFASGIS